MDTAQKYIFDTDFEEEAKRILLEIKQEAKAEAKSEVEETAPTFTEEDVNTARTEGFNAGKEEGIREAANATEQRVLDTLKALSQQTEQIFHTMEESNSTAIRNAMSVGASIVHKLFPHLNERHAGTEVEALIDTVIKQVISDPTIRVHVNAGLSDVVKKRIAQTAAEIGHADKVDVIADSTIPEGNCRLEWESGGATRDAAGMWRDVDEILERNLSGNWKALKEVADAIAAEKAATPEPLAEQSDTTSIEPDQEEQLATVPEVAAEEVTEEKVTEEEVAEEEIAAEEIAAEEIAAEEVTVEDNPEITPEENSSGPETSENDPSITDDTPEGQGDENG
jgi:flagellar assembly protein FliH